MRRCYLVCYDIRNPKRLRRVRRLCRGYGEAWQYSVFFCVLKEIDRVRLQSDLEGQMNLKEDHAVLVDPGGDEGPQGGDGHRTVPPAAGERDRGHLIEDRPPGARRPRRDRPGPIAGQCRIPRLEILVP